MNFFGILLKFVGILLVAFDYMPLLVDFSCNWKFSKKYVILGIPPDFLLHFSDFLVPSVVKKSRARVSKRKG